MVLDLRTFAPTSARRVLFVSSTTGGGSGRSQRELNDALRQRGVETMMLVDDGDGHAVTRVVFEQLWDASVRLESLPLLGGSTAWLRSLPGRQATANGDQLVSLAPENAFPEVARSFRPDVVVGSSISRPSWRVIRAACRRLDIPAVLYLREETALAHLAPSQGAHDAVLANSRTLVAGARTRGVDATFIPSLVDVSSAQTHTTRERVLLVNPREQHGVDVVEDLAACYPTIEFVLQESWPLTPDERSNVDRILAQRSNVVFRPRCDSPAEVYADAAILLTPHRIDNRPRVVLEALANGIPVITSDLPGLVESVGPGGVVVERTQGIAGWRDALERLWQNPRTYRELQGAARAFSRRDEVQRNTILASFLAELDRTITERESRRRR